MISYIDLDLRIFDVMTTLTESLSPEMKEYYRTRLIDIASPNLIHDQFGQKHPIPKNNGKTIEFRKLSPLAKAMTPLTEGVTPAGNRLTVTKITSTIAQYGDYITSSDLLELTAIDPNQEMNMTTLGDQAGRTLDTVTREVITAGTNVMYAPKSDGTEVLLRENVSRDCLLTPKLINQAVAKLKRMNAKKINGYFIGIVHTDTACDLQNNKDWIEVHKYTDSEKIYEGEIGKLGGVRFVETSEAKIIGGAGENGDAVYCTMIIGADAYGTTDIEGGGLEYIIQQLGSGGTEDPLKQRSSCGWKATKTAERLVEEFMVRIEHGSESNPEAESN